MSSSTVLYRLYRTEVSKHSKEGIERLNNILPNFAVPLYSSMRCAASIQIRSRVSVSLSLLSGLLSLEFLMIQSCWPVGRGRLVRVSAPGDSLVRDGWNEVHVDHRYTCQSWCLSRRPHMPFLTSSLLPGRQSLCPIN